MVVGALVATADAVGRVRSTWAGGDRESEPRPDAYGDADARRHPACDVVKRDAHVFRARDRAGNLDATPVVKRFSISKR